MPTYLIEIDLSGDETLAEKFYKLVESLSDAPRDSDPDYVSGESDSVGVTHEEPLRGIIVVRTHPLTTILQILSPHLPHFRTAPKITQTTETGIYDASGYPVQQLLIYVPLHLSLPSDHPNHQKEDEDEDEINGEDEEDSSDDTKIQKLQTLFNVISMQLSREGKVSGMRQGEIEGIPGSTNPSNPSSLETETVGMGTEMETAKETQFNGQECRVWSVWTAWVAAKEKYDGCWEGGERGEGDRGDEYRGEGDEGKSLAERVDWGKIGVLGWEESNWMFMGFGEFLARETEKKRCVVM
ncbi:hypothetical protein OCU04_010308 [Sclerotinia nivalis]|uniref:Uncharacterized protein n=1 Tax=Sclerotinia nivalis TaxID=352851 RepID=A0A9X0AE91_9HELO|nr:hypothetical protein OCU04_010308 [Sclerotinia nivalis]